jgi:hypothetical protein
MTAPWSGRFLLNDPLPTVPTSFIRSIAAFVAAALIPLLDPASARQRSPCRAKLREAATQLIDEITDRGRRPIQRGHAYPDSHGVPTTTTHDA